MNEYTLVLGGGAALGFAHIGALKVIEKHFKITRVIGTSMGALVGGLYAYGLTPDEILAFGKEFKLSEFVNPFNLDVHFQGFFDGKFLEKRFNEITKHSNIEDLKIPFTAVTYDLNSKRTVLLNSGNLGVAIRSSSAIPYIFNPVHVADMLLVDGGVEYPLPLIDIKPEEKVIAINVMPTAYNSIIKAKAIKSVSKIKIKNAKKWYEIIIESINCNQAFLVQQCINNISPDIYIDCNVDHFHPADFHKIEQISEIGKQKAYLTLKSLT